jgi:hypothetical protein
MKSRVILSVLLITSGFSAIAYDLGVEDGRDDKQHRVDELLLENRDLRDRLQQANGRSSSEALKQTRRVESLENTLDKKNERIDTLKDQKFRVGAKLVLTHLVANETGDVDPDGDGVTTAVEVYYCHDPQNASQTPAVNRFSDRNENNCEYPLEGDA